PHAGRPQCGGRRPGPLAGAGGRLRVAARLRVPAALRAVAGARPAERAVPAAVRRRASLGRIGPPANAGRLPAPDRGGDGRTGAGVRGIAGGVRPGRVAVRALPDAAGLRALAAGPRRRGAGAGCQRGVPGTGGTAGDADLRGGCLVLGGGGGRPGRRSRTAAGGATGAGYGIPRAGAALTDSQGHFLPTTSFTRLPST